MLGNRAALRWAVPAILVTAAVSAAVCGEVLASPSAAPIDSYAIQPDGYRFAIRAQGNADAVWQETLDGYTVVKNENGQWVYALPRSSAVARSAAGSTQSLLPTDFVVGNVDPAAMGLSKNLIPTASVQTRAAVRAAKSVRNPIADISGSVPLLVILGYYDDALGSPNCAACAMTDPGHFQEVVFATDGRRSVKDYFDTVSLGTVTVTPARENERTANDGVVGWLRLGGATPEGTNLNTTAYKSHKIAADAINAAMDFVDFTSYDANNDGALTSKEMGILVVVAGYEGSYGRDAAGRTLSDDFSSPRFWGQSRSFSPSYSGVPVPVQHSGGSVVRINTTSFGMTYSVVGELHGDHPATMGILAHELGHSVFGLPDLYDVSGDSSGVGVWSLMGFGSWGQSHDDPQAGQTPVVLDAWSRQALGWLELVTVESGSTASIDHAGGPTPVVVYVPTPDSDEYFLLENRQYTGYDKGLSRLLFTTDFGGLAVWHVDEGVGAPGMNNDNSNAFHKRVDLVAAIGDDALDSGSSYGRRTNLFYAGNKSALSDDTDPGTTLYSGADSGVAVTNIGFPDLVMTAVVNFQGGGSDDNVTARAAQEGGGGGGGGGAVSPSLAFVLIALWQVTSYRRRYFLSNPHSYFADRGRLWVFAVGR